MVRPSAGLEIDIELGELQLHVTDVMQEKHQNAHIVVPGEESGAGQGRGRVTLEIPTLH